MNKTAALYALASAALFGASTPAAKLLLGAIDPIVLAGLPSRHRTAIEAQGNRPQALQRQMLPSLPDAVPFIARLAVNRRPMAG